jgi:hypothetical protein
LENWSASNFSEREIPEQNRIILGKDIVELYAMAKDMYIEEKTKNVKVKL